MKKIICILLSGMMMAGLPLWSQESITSQVTPRFDERVELISTICRLAGFQEYCMAENVGYTDELDEAFSLFRDHPVVEYAKEVRERNGVGYDAWMHLAVYLDIEGGEVRFNPAFQKIKLLASESRWKDDTVDLFIGKLNDFYKSSGFAGFYQAHSSYYAGLEEKFQDILNNTDLSWFGRFFGKEAGEFRPILSVINYHANYGTRTIGKDDQEIPHAIIGVVFDKEGNIPSSKGIIGLIVHEFAHSYCNPLIYGWYDKLAASGEAIYPPIKEQMTRQAYAGWKTVLCEALVRASVVTYIAQDSYFQEEDVRSQIEYERKRGFYWVEVLAAEMKKYSEQRERYLTFDEFMPHVVAMYDSLAHKVKEESLAKGATDGTENKEEISCRVDERTELVSLVCRLAGFKEYNLVQEGEYIEEVDTHFSSLRSHSVISYAQELNRKDGVAYDAWMSLAVHLQIKDGIVSFNPDLQLGKLVEYEGRWKEDTIEDFISRLNEFYGESNFNNFFREQATYRKEFEQKYSKFVKPEHLKGIADYFKEPMDKVEVILNLLNGTHGYGAKTVDKEGRVVPYMIVGIMD